MKVYHLGKGFSVVTPATMDGHCCVVVDRLEQAAKVGSEQEFVVSDEAMMLVFHTSHGARGLAEAVQKALETIGMEVPFTMKEEIDATTGI